MSCSQGHFRNVPPLFPQGLRLNRTLVCLSLSNNQIGDVGATQLARVIIYLASEDLVLLPYLLYGLTPSPVLSDPW